MIKKENNEENNEIYAKRKENEEKVNENKFRQFFLKINYFYSRF